MSQHTLSVLVNNHPGLLSKGLRSFQPPQFQHRQPGSRYLRDPRLLTHDDRRQWRRSHGRPSDQAIGQTDRCHRNRASPGPAFCFPGNGPGQSRCRSQPADELLQIAEIFRAKIVDVSLHHITLELTGQADKINGFLKLLEDFKILRIVRTGTIAVPRREES